MAAVLEVDRLCVAFPMRHGGRVVLDDVSLDLSAGETLGVVGESGAGKSITGQAILGLLPPPGRIAGGTIRLGGARIDDLAEERLRAIRGRQIGAIFQDPLTSLDPLFSIGSQLVETIRTHLDVGAAAARTRALALLADVGLPAPVQQFDSFPHQLSGGMRQRVVIALALCADPVVIVADEPTTALDVSTQAQVVALLKRLCAERGVAVLLITHDIGVIAEMADRVAVMYAGRIVETGPARDVLLRPRHPYTTGLIGAIPPIDRSVERLVQIAGAMPRPGALPPGCAFQPRCPAALPRCAEDRPAALARRAAASACWLHAP